MVYNSFEFGERKGKATMLLSYVSGSGEQISDKQMADATNKMLTARSDVYNDMIMYVNAARKLGMNDDDLEDVMSASGVTGDDIDSIMDGEVPEWEMPNEFGEKSLTRAMLTAYDDERRQELEDEMDRRREIIDEIIDNQ